MTFKEHCVISKK